VARLRFSAAAKNDLDSGHRDIDAFFHGGKR